MNAPAETARLNDGQRAALDLGRDLIVSAGAGAGKTQVLGLRCLAILEEGRAGIAEIVAFTFTEKAAAEMRERVQRLLLERLAELPPESTEFARLRKAQAEFSRNRISTIHGFCHRVLRDYAWEAAIEPRAPILDERAQSIAREAAIRRVLLQVDTQSQPDLAAALVRLGGEVRLFTLTQTLGQMIKDRAAMRGPLHQAAEAWQDPPAEVARRRAQWQALCDREIQPALDAVEQIDVGASKGARDGDKLRDLVLALQEAARRRDGRALRDLLLKKDGDPKAVGGAKGNWKHAPDMLEVVRDQVWQAALALAPAAELLGFAFDEAFEMRAGRVAQDLALVFDHACAAYEEECAGGLDFLDLELRALKLLRENAEVRAEVIRHARYILIDEYQDTNPVQAELFALLAEGDSPPGRFFAVGDAKQSIYAFRGSDVAVFNHGIERIPARNAGVHGPQALPWGLTCQDSPERRGGIIRLEHNYRTIPPVLELGNTVFRSVFARETWRDFDARPQDMLAGAEDLPGSVEMHLLPDKPGTEAERRRRDDEAEFIAQRIRRLHEEGMPYSDIAVLVRRRTRNWQYRNAFARHDVPLLVVGEGGLFETQEALDCVNLLRVLANPADDVAVLGLLRSPLAGLSDVQLTGMALATDRHATLFNRLAAWADKPPVAADFLVRLRGLQARAGRDSPAVLLGEVLSAFGYALAVGCGPDCEQRLANVTRMLDLVRRMQQDTPSLAPLVRELVARIERGEDEAQGAAAAGADGVRLMTIHHAKGLEFPVVIVPDLGSDPGGGDNGLVRDLPVEGPLGVHLKSLDDDDRGESRCDFAAWLARRDARERAAAEERRILYVAWTRAAQRVVLVGTIGDDLGKDRWAHQLLRAFGVTRHGQESPHEALELAWHTGVTRAQPAPHTSAIAAVREALAAGRVKLPAKVDASLVAPIGTSPEGLQPVDPQAVEIGTLVHAELERCLRLRTHGLEVGVIDARAVPHVSRALDAFATLRPARTVTPEFEVMTPDGPRRFDLLRELEGDEYEIIDYKTDVVEADLAEFAQARHGEQLRHYGRCLTEYLVRRGRTWRAIRLLVCFTAPDGLRPEERLVEIPL